MIFERRVIAISRKGRVRMKGLFAMLGSLLIIWSREREKERAGDFKSLAEFSKGSRGGKHPQFSKKILPPGRSHKRRPEGQKWKRSNSNRRRVFPLREKRERRTSNSGHDNALRAGNKWWY